MLRRSKTIARFLAIALSALMLSWLTACIESSSAPISNNSASLQVKVLVGSAVGEFCQQAAQKFNQQNPKLENGQAFQIICENLGSGDVVTSVTALAEQLAAGTIKPEDQKFPTLISLDGEIYQSQLIYRLQQIFPGKKYLPDLTESPLLASSPMVFMAQPDVAQGLQKQPDPFKILVTAKTHKDIDPSGPALPVNYVHTAPTKSNSGLQTLVAQYAAVSGKRPEELTVDDVTKFQSQIQQIQSKITRYGVSTNSLAKSMAKNGPFWASVGSVYESSVIAVNSQLPAGQAKFQAVYPQATFSSNMRVILPTAPWVSADEKAAADKFIKAWLSPEYQQIATELGLRPGTPGVSLGSKFTPDFGVDPNPTYDSYRPPQPDVVAAMLKNWSEISKKPSQVVIVVDSSGSMQGNKMPAVQSTLSRYINNLGPKEKVALIDFDSVIRQPVLADGTPEGKQRGLQFVASLEVGGGTKLYDAVLLARNWLKQNRQANAINGVLVLTDGEDSGSTISLDQLGAELQKSGFQSDDRIAFFTIGYGNEGDFNPNALKKIAELNGGYYSKGDPETINRLMDNLQVEF